MLAVAKDCSDGMAMGTYRAATLPGIVSRHKWLLPFAHSRAVLRRQW